MIRTLAKFLIAAQSMLGGCGAPQKAERPVHNPAASSAARSQELDEPGSGKIPPLHQAVARGDSQRVDTLIDGGAPLEQIDEHGLTPLGLAALTGQREIAELLIERGARVDARDGNALTPLAVASLRGQREVAEFLLARSADPFQPQSLLSLPALAEREGHTEYARWLLDIMKKRASNDPELVFDVSLVQAGHAVPIDDTTAKLARKPFELVISFEADHTVLVSAGLRPELHRRAVAGENLDDPFGIRAKGLAYAANNPDEEIAVDTDAFHTLSAREDGLCNEVRRDEDGRAVCILRIRQLFIKRTHRPLTEIDELYLVFVSARTASRMEAMLARRSALRLVFQR